MTGPFATRIFRIILGLAGCYNLAFGLWAGFWPHHFFEVFAIAPPRYPGIWACVGMVVGLYGFLYWYAAWKPHHARPIVAVGLLGKVLGPIGMVVTFSDQWPLRLGMLNVFNDVIWWVPFALFLLRGTMWAPPLVSLTPWICAGLHVLATAAMAILLRPGTLIEPEAVQRASFIAQHTVSWSVGWGIWMLSGLSLVTFYAWWGARLSIPLVATAAVMLAAFGSVCDLAGESLSVLVLTEVSKPALTDSSMWDPTSFLRLERVAVLLTAGAANSLYTLGGLALMVSTENLPRSIRFAMWGTWIAGIGMTLAALLNHVSGMVVTTALLFPLLIGWTAWMGKYWGRR